MTDPRSPALLEAARVSATVTDPHLLRVLDCDDSDGITWVVNEWGDGVSLDLMLQQGTLPPSRAAWLAREVADAIAVGHAQGVAHGRLNPEAVLVTHSGAVKLIGYVVDASLEPPRAPDPLYGEIDDREADVIDVAGILYAALTGRWPGVSRSAVPRAPHEGRRPLRPRQVRAGVPRTLDVICERVLHKEASQHALPIETAQEIAAALADYVGDPTPGRAPGSRGHARRAHGLDPARRPGRPLRSLAQQQQQPAEDTDRTPSSTTTGWSPPSSPSRRDPGTAARGGAPRLPRRSRTSRAAPVRRHRAAGPPRPPGVRDDHDRRRWRLPGLRGEPRPGSTSSGHREEPGTGTPAVSGPSSTRATTATTCTPARRVAGGCGSR